MSTSTISDIDVVRGGFEAVAAKDLPAFVAGFHPDATWNHRNDDRLGGVHRGRDGIAAFLVQSIELTAGTLQAVPLSFLADGEGRVCVPVTVSAERPDGRSFSDAQLMLFTVEDGLVRSAEQYIGDAATVTAFWA